MLGRTLGKIQGLRSWVLVDGTSWISEKFWGFHSLDGCGDFREKLRPAFWILRSIQKCRMSPKSGGGRMGRCPDCGSS